MCLTRVTTTYPTPSELIQDGWKEFDGNSPALKFQQYGGNVPLDKWIASTEIRTPTGDIVAKDGSPYMPGFHVYSDEEECKKSRGMSVRRVYVRKVTCAGIQEGNYLHTVIAQEMYVPSNSNDWPPKAASASPPPNPPAPAPKGNLMKRITGRKQ